MTATGQGGLLIAFEGIDGSGKSTQLTTLADRLREAGRSVTVSAEPTKGAHGQALRDAWLSGRRLPVEEELALFEADRREHVTGVIRPALERGELVLVDRYYYSSAAYQGTQWALDSGGNGAAVAAEQAGDLPPGPEAVLRRFEAFCPRADLVLLFDLPVDEALRRMRAARSVLDAMEARENLERVRAAFLALNRDEVVTVDASREPDDVRREVWDVVRARLGLAKD